MPGMATPPSSPPPVMIYLSDCPADSKDWWAEQLSWSFIVLVAVLVVVGLLGSLLLAAMLGRLCMARSSRRTQLFVRNMGCPPQLKLPPGCKWHLFLSHTWANGQDQCAKIKTGLRLCVRSMKVFLDVDDLEDLQFLERDVKATAVVLIFLTKSYFKSANCQREIRACMREDKPLILVRETAPSKGGTLMPVLTEECPAVRSCGSMSSATITSTDWSPSTDTSVCGR